MNMTVKHYTVPTTVAEAQRLIDAHTVVDNFRADLRLACEIRPYSDEIGHGIATRYFGGTAVLPAVGTLVYAVRRVAAARRQRVADPKPDCANPWGIEGAFSCAEKILFDLEEEAATALTNVLLHGPWPI
jgi:hypothetical protein